MMDGGTQTATPTATPTPTAPAPSTAIPKELLELSETTIGSDGAIKGESFEIRRAD